MELLLSYDSKYQPVIIEHIQDLNIFAEVYYNFKADEIEYFMDGNKIDLSNICLSKLHAKQIVIKKKEKVDLMKFQMEHITYQLVHIDLYYETWKFKAIIDTGCQRTMMTLDMVKKMNLEDKIDTSIRRNMTGVGGMQETVGIIRDLVIKISNKYEICINTEVVQPHETMKNMMLIGLDFMHTYDFSINIRRNEMIIEGIKVQLLNEEQIDELKEPINWFQEKLIIGYNILRDIIGRDKMNEVNQTIRTICINIIQNEFDNKYRSINSKSNIFMKNPELINFFKSWFWYEENNKLNYKGPINVPNMVLKIAGHS